MNDDPAIKNSYELIRDENGELECIRLRIREDEEPGPPTFTDDHLGITVDVEYVVETHEQRSRREAREWEKVRQRELWEQSRRRNQ